jgi:hypothetical protein
MAQGIVKWFNEKKGFVSMLTLHVPPGNFR